MSSSDDPQLVTDESVDDVLEADEDYDDDELRLSGKTWLSIGLFIFLVVFTVNCVIFDVFG